MNITNSESGLFAVYDIASRGFKNYIQAKKGAELASVKQQEQPPFTASKGYLKKYQGRYVTIGVYVDIKERDGTLYVKPSATDIELILEPVAKDLFKPIVRFLFFIIDGSYVEFLIFITTSFLLFEASIKNFTLCIFLEL